MVAYRVTVALGVLGCLALLHLAVESVEFEADVGGHADAPEAAAHVAAYSPLHRLVRVIGDVLVLHQLHLLDQTRNSQSLGSSLLSKKNNQKNY